MTKLIAEELGAITAEIEAGGDEVTDDHAEKVAKIIERLDPALDAELRLKSAYILTKRDTH